MSFSPSSLSLFQGETKDLTITLTRTNLPGLVAFDLASPPPNGVSASFEPSSTTENTTTLRVRALGNAPAGSYTLRVRVSQSGFSQVAELPLWVEPALAPDLRLSLSEPNPSVGQGQSLDLLVGVERRNIGGEVVLSLVQQNGSPLPTGLSATFSPTLPNSTASILRITTASTLSTGTYPLRIRALLGTLERTLDFILAVLPPSALSDFQLSLPQYLRLAKGQSLESPVEIARNNLLGPIELALERQDGSPLPTGLTASFDPIAPEGFYSRLVLTAAPDLPTGGYLLRLRGTRDGLERTALLLLSIFDQAELTVSGAVWVAGQDNSDAWRAVLPSNGRYLLEVGNPAGRYGWAVVCSRQEAGLTTHQVGVYQLTLSEVRSLALQCPPAASSSSFADIGGQLNGLGGSYGQVAYGPATDFVDPGRTLPNPDSPAYPGYLLRGVPHGTADLLAVRYLPPAAPGTVFEADRAIFQRGYTVGGNQTQNLDLTGSSSFALEVSYTATLNGCDPSSQGLSYVAYQTAATRGLYLADSQQQAIGLTYRAIPNSRRNPGEFYVFAARETSFSNLSLRTRQVLRRFASPQNTSATFPSLPGASLTLLNNRPLASWTAGYPWPGGGTRLFGLKLAQLAVGANTNLEWNLYLTPGWLQSTSSYPVPDLSQTCAAGQTPCAPLPGNAPANGWQSVWSLRSDLELDWSFSAAEVSLPLADWLPLAESPTPPGGLDLDGFSFAAASDGGILNPNALTVQRIQPRLPRLLPPWLAPR